MIKNERNYPAKFRNIRAIFVEGTNYLTKGKIYLATSDVVDNRVIITDDSGETNKSYLASHFEFVEPTYIRVVQPRYSMAHFNCLLQLLVLNSVPFEVNYSAEYLRVFILSTDSFVAVIVKDCVANVGIDYDCVTITDKINPPTV